MTELSEVKERQLLQAIHEVSSGKADEEHGQGADPEETRKRKADEDDEEKGGEKRGMLQAVGELLSHSAHSVKEAVLGNGESHESDSGAPHSSSKAPSQSADTKDELAQESILVHTVVYD
ncbi:hypothetical protein L7F22_018155 [Adiantum nelumboides]|nr:hypothetical protein [Adiantum nelumboides]